MCVQRGTETQTHHRLQRSLAQVVHPQASTPVPEDQAFPCSEGLLHVNRAGRRSSANEWGAPTRRSLAIAASPIATRRAAPSTVVVDVPTQSSLGPQWAAQAGNGGLWRAGRPWLP